jgi:hypothetical protein
VSKCKKGFNRHRWAKVGGYIACMRCFQARNPAAGDKMLRLEAELEVVRDIETPVIPPGYIYE